MTKKRTKPAAAEAAPATGSACCGGLTVTIVRSWRDLLPIHPAAEMFPRMSPSEVTEVAADIKKNGLKIPIVLWRADPDSKPMLLDGISRLDAIEIVTGCPVMVEGPHIKRLVRGRGAPFDGRGMVEILDGRKVDPWAYVISANIHRRHLTMSDKDRLIVELLKGDPTKSDRQIAKTIKASPTYVGKVRAKKEATGDVSTVDTRRDTKGRNQPARKSAKASAKAKASKVANVPKVEAPKNAATTPTAAAKHLNGSSSPAPRSDVNRSAVVAGAPKDAIEAKAAAPSKALDDIPAFLDRKQNGIKNGADGGSPEPRGDVNLSELNRELEIKIVGHKAEVEDAKAGAHLDADVRSFLDALIPRVSKMDGEDRKRLFAALHELLAPEAAS